MRIFLKFTVYFTVYTNFVCFVIVSYGTMFMSARERQLTAEQHAEIAVACLKEYMEDFQERNPNFYVFNAVMHLDEATPHLHIDYIPLGHFFNGLEKRNAMARALEEMGYGKGANAINRWRLSEWKVLHDICAKHGFEINEPKKSRGYSFTTPCRYDRR